MSTLLHLLNTNDNQSTTEVGLLLCGDSLTSTNMDVSATTAYKENNGIITTLNARMKQRFKLINYFDQGVGGEKAQDRVSTLAEYTTVVGNHPEIKAAVEAYGRNDISSGRTAAQVTADRQTIITHLLTLVDVVFVESIKPSDYTPNTVSYNQEAETSNASMKTWCDANPRLYFIDTYAALGDDTGLDSGNSYDSIHLTAQGAWRAASVYKPIVMGVYGMGGELDTSINDLAVNPDLSGTGGTTSSGVTGDIADNWRGSHSGGTTDITRTASKTAEGYQRFVIDAGTSAGADEKTYFEQDIVTGFNTGEVYRAHMTIKVNSISNGYWLGLQVLQRDSGSSTIYTVSDLDKRDTSSLLDGPNMAGERIHLQALDFVVLEDCTEIEIRLSMGVTANGSEADMDIEIESAALEHVTAQADIREFLPDDIEFFFEPGLPSSYTYNTLTLKVSQINDHSYNSNDATTHGSYTNEIVYNSSVSALGGLPALENIGPSEETSHVAYRFSHSIAAVADARTLVCVCRGDTGTGDAGSSNNAAFTMGDTDTSDSTGSVRQQRDNHAAHQMSGYGYSSNYGDTTDELKTYWVRHDGTDVDGGHNLSVTEGPSTAVDPASEDAYGYIAGDPTSSTRPYVGWIRHSALFSKALNTTELYMVLRVFAAKNNITL